jgi:hypothetical protein
MQSYNRYIKCKIIDKNMMITIEKEGLIIYPHRGALSPLDMSFGEHVLSLLIITITNYLLINYYVMNIYLYVFMFITLPSS